MTSEAARPHWCSAQVSFGSVIAASIETCGRFVVRGRETLAQRVVCRAGSGDPRTAGGLSCGVGRPSHSGWFVVRGRETLAQRRY